VIDHERRARLLREAIEAILDHPQRYRTADVRAVREIAERALEHDNDAVAA
jgi:hypothetical protein